MWLCLLAGLSLPTGQIDTPPPEAPPPARPAAPAPDRWFLMRELQGTWPGWLLDGTKVQVYGWTEAAFTASSDAHDQLPMGFNYRANEVHVQQDWLRVERAVDSTSRTPTFGFRSDTLFGIDYRFTIARGLFDSQLTANQGEPATYGVDPVQFYAEGYFPGLARGTDVKFGRFFAQFGAESIDTTQNSLASHSYTFIYNPFTHTGLLTTTKLSDAWSVQNGIVTGCDIFIDSASSPCYIGSVKWAPPTGRASLLLSVILGKDRFDQKEAFHNPEIVDVVFTYKLHERLNYTLDALYGFTTNVPDTGFANWFSTVHYLNWTLGPRVSATTRLEFFDDAQGQRTSFRGLYTAATAGVTFKPRKAISLRPEVRYDYNGESRPFEDHHGVLTGAFDVLIRW